MNETAGPDGSTDDARSIRLLAGLARRIAASLDLRETLQIVVDSVVGQLGFGVALVNMARPGDRCEAVAIAGPREATEALIGTSAPMDTWRQLLASCERWGELRFLDHREDQRQARSIAGWVPPGASADVPDAWHPEDVLLAPLHGPDGTLIGVLSVDLPVGGRRPDARSCQLLEQFAVHAALAIEHARVHTFVADSERLFRAMFDQSPIAIALLTDDHRVTRVNNAFEQLLGRPAAALLGHAAAELARPDPAPAGRATDATAIPPGHYEIHFTRPDGSEVWGRVSATLLAAETSTRPSVFLTQSEDITSLRTMQAQFAYAATHDQLTGLANRALVLDRLTAVLTETAAGGGRVAVFYCDLDSFKEINDTRGHAAGDEILTAVARRLKAAAREQDTAGRLGGDEFVLIGCPVRTATEAARIASRLIGAIQEPLMLASELMSPSVSIGVALSGPGDNADHLLAQADQALYVAKAAGGGQWQLATGS